MKHRINIMIYVTLVAITAFFFNNSAYFIPLLIIWTTIFLIVLTFGVLFLRFNYFLPSIIRSSTEECILTFDDGPDPIQTPKILNTLRKKNIKAIFFVIGKKAEKHPELIQQIRSEGHLIGNHSYSHHKMLAIFPTTTLIEDLEKCQSILLKITGIENKLFRAPIGYTNPNFGRAIKVLKLHSIGWNVRSYDTLAKNKSKFLKRLLKKTKASSIILFHDNLSFTSDVLEEYIDKAQMNGILFASNNLQKKLSYD